MNLKPATIPAKFERAPALARLQLRFRGQQNNPVMRNSPAVKEMQKKRAV